MPIMQPLVALFISLQTPVAPVGPLTMDQAAALAERNAFAVRIQATTVEKDRQIVKETQGQLGPQASGSLTYTRYPNAIKTQFGTISVVEQPIDQQTGAISIQLPIDISGNTRRMIRANKANYRAAQRTLEAAMNDARLNARSEYLAVLRAMASIVVDKQALADAQERLKQANQQFAQQEIAKIDVLAFETAVSQSESDLLNAQNSLVLAKQALNVALALPVEAEIQVVEVDTLPSVGAQPTSLVTAAKSRRPEVKALNETVTALQNIARATESGQNPTLNVGLNLSSNFNPLPGNQATTYVGTATFNLPLFDSGITRAKVRAARQDVAAAKVQLEQQLLGVSQDVRAALANLSSANARYKNAEQQVGYAQETYRLAVVKQKAGEGTYVEVIDAQNSLTQAKNGLLSARYDYLTAYAQLQRAVGTDNLATVALTTATGGMN